MSTRRLIVALTTVADEPAARDLARALVEERLAACVQRVAIRSTYVWNAVVEDSAEVLLIIKSTPNSVDALRARVLALHGYDVPEFVVLESSDVAQAYLTWATAACGGKGES